MEYKPLQTNHTKKLLTLFCIMLLTLGILFMACGAFAQQTIYIGPYMGMGTQQSYNSNFYKDPSVKTCSVPRPTFGVSAQDSMTSNISLGFGMGYTAFSTQAQFTTTTKESGTSNGSYYNNYGYVTTPISLLFKSKTSGTNTIGFFGELQLIPAINTAAQQKETLTGSSLIIDNEASILADIKSQTRPVNIMMGISGGLLLGTNNLMIEIGPYYTTSLTDIKRPPYQFYTSPSGQNQNYTPTYMRAIGANVTVAVKINTHKAKHTSMATSPVVAK